MNRQKMRKPLYSLVAVALFLGSGAAGAGGAGGGATEYTQILNNLQLVQSYAKQVEAFLRQGMQLEAQLKNLMSNPFSVLGSDVQILINEIGSIMNTGQSIGYNLAQIDRNFANNFKSPTAANFAKNFTNWNKTNTDTLQSVLRSVGTSRDQFPTTQAALTDLYNRSQATGGNLQALQTLSQINIKQIQQLQGLQEIISNQAAAETTYMATQTAKEQKNIDNLTAMDDRGGINIPSISSAPAPSWNNLGK